jgi:predicted NBD/HSP70 family sugar kinase
MLTNELGLDLGPSARVRVANDADLGALAEHQRGAGVNVGHLIYLSGEAGIGAGIIQDGKPMMGAAGYAGEAGHSLINPSGHQCRCGAIGCWETEAGEPALARLAGIPDSIAGLGVLHIIMSRASAGDPPTLAAIEGIGRWLGIGIGNLINLFNPELVVLGGIYHALYPYLEAATLEGVQSQTLEAPGDIARITRSALGAEARVIGAAEMALSEVLSDPAGTIGASWSVGAPVQGRRGV